MNSCLSNVIPKWSHYSNPLDFDRLKSSFPPFPDVLSDPGGQMDEWLKITRVIPLGAHEHKCLKGWGLKPRTINDSMWFWIADGKGWFWIGNEHQRFNFHSGDLILIPQGMTHAIFLKPGSSMYMTAAHFHAKVFGSINLLDLLGFPYHVPALPKAPFERVSVALAREHALNAPGCENAMAGDIMSVLLFIIRHYGHLFRPIQVKQLHHKLLPLIPVLTCIEKRMDDPDLAIPQLADRAGCSVAYLRKRFKIVTGLSPVVFLQRRRIEQASIHLRQSSLSIKEIAERTGFRDLGFFYRVFRRWAGVTPACYRNDLESDQ